MQAFWCMPHITHLKQINAILGLQVTWQENKLCKCTCIWFQFFTLRGMVSPVTARKNYPLNIFELLKCISTSSPATCKQPLFQTGMYRSFLKGKSCLPFNLFLLLSVKESSLTVWQYQTGRWRNIDPFSYLCSFWISVTITNIFVN